MKWLTMFKILACESNNIWTIQVNTRSRHLMKTKFENKALIDLEIKRANPFEESKFEIHWLALLAFL